MRLENPMVWVMMGAAFLLASACNGEAAGSREMTIVVEADTERIQEKESQLARQWSEIEAERERLITERQALLSRMERGDDLARLAAEQRRILEREQALRQQESRAVEDRSALTEEITRIVQTAAAGGAASAGGAVGGGGGGGGEAATRAATDVARRESDLARREADLAEREKALAEREARIAEREASAGRLVASAAAAAPAPQPGRRVTSAQVEQAHRQVRRTMRQRGLLPGDLPPEVAALDRQVYDLSRRGRFDEALDTVSSLGDAVGALQVNEAFIQAKMSRLGRLRQGKQLTAEQSRQVEELLAQATSAFADGRHGDANGRLNRIFGILSD